LNILHWHAFEGAGVEPAIEALAMLGVLVLMFLAGLEVDPQALLRAGRAATSAGVLGVLVPIVVAVLVFPMTGHGAQESLFLGLILAATSVSISAQTLMELGVLRSKVGITLLGAAIIDDVLVVLVLAVVLALGFGAGGLGSVFLLLLKMAAFLAVVGVAGRPVVRRLSHAVDDLPISEGVIALVLVTTLMVSWASEELGGMAAITGAFMAGLLFRDTVHHDHIEDGMHTLAYSLLVPVFFVHIGLQADARAIGAEGLPFAAGFILVAALTKIIGCAVGAKASGFSARDAIRLGVGMTSRGEVGLIVASIGIQAGGLTPRLYAVAVVMVVVTTLITPPMLRALYPSAAGGVSPPAETVAEPVREVPGKEA
jgi:Kef-type K+ transport system membrane component KefB